MGYTLEELVRELGGRRDDLALATAEATGTRTTLVARDLESSLPVDYTKLYCWVYGSQTALGTGNRGHEVRASGWDHTTKTLALMEPGFPDPTTGGTYEVHFRSARAQKVRAVNSGIRQLFLHWFRDSEAASDLLTDSRSEYDFPDGTHLGTFTEVDVEMSVPGHAPQIWASAAALQPRLVRRVGDAGDETWTLDFASPPPSGRYLRVRGALGYETVAQDTDVLPLDGNWGGIAYEWLMAYAGMCLADWDMARQVSHEAQIAQAISRRELEKQRGLILLAQQAHATAPIIVPAWSTAPSGVG